MLGSQGRVHAVDLQPSMIERTRERAAGAGVSPLVQLHQLGLYDLPFADDSIDLAVLISTLGEIPDNRRRFRNCAACSSRARGWALRMNCSSPRTC